MNYDLCQKYKHKSGARIRQHTLRFLVQLLFSLLFSSFLFFSSLLFSSLLFSSLLFSSLLFFSLLFSYPLPPFSSLPPFYYLPLFSSLLLQISAGFFPSWLLLKYGQTDALLPELIELVLTNL